MPQTAESGQGCKDCEHYQYHMRQKESCRKWWDKNRRKTQRHNRTSQRIIMEAERLANKV